MPSPEQNAHGRGGPNQTLGAHARFGQAEMQRLVGLARQIAINVDEIARTRNFAGNDDLILAQAAFNGQFGGFDGREHHALVDDFFGSLAEILVGVLLHLAHDQFLIERAAIHADAHGLAVVARHFADGGELFVAALAVAHVAGIDAVLVEGAGAIGIFGEQHVAVVVEIADDGRRRSRHRASAS